MTGNRKVEILQKKEIPLINLKEGDLFTLTDIDVDGSLSDDAVENGKIIYIAVSNAYVNDAGINVVASQEMIPGTHTPEQYQTLTGKPWPEDGAIYYRITPDSEWEVDCYYYYINSVKYDYPDSEVIVATGLPPEATEYDPYNGCERVIRPYGCPTDCEVYKERQRELKTE